MPAKSKNQARLFRLVKKVKSGLIKPEDVSPTIRKLAKKMSSRSIDHFAKTDDSKLPYKVKEVIKEIVSKVLCEMQDPVIRNVVTKDDFSEYIEKSENQSDSKFTKEELSIIKSLDVQPYEENESEIKYSATEPTNNKNKEFIVRKKGKRYVGFFSVRNPVDLSSEEPSVDLLKNKEDDEEKSDDSESNLDDIFIKISRPFDKNLKYDLQLLSNFIDVITKEYNIK